MIDSSETDPEEVTLDDLSAPITLPESARKRHRKPSALRSLVEWLLVIVGSVGAALLVQAFLFQPFRIPSLSMYPTLDNGDRIVVNKLSYRVHDVNRGDVVVFLRPDCEKPGTPVWANCASVAQHEDLVKRVIGLPGDRINISDNKVFINGQALDEPYVNPGSAIVARPYGCGFTASAAKPYVIPKDRVFVMGDNRDDSIDSRCFGPIRTSHIVGRAFVIVWPIGRIGGL